MQKQVRERVIALMEERGWTQTDVARAADLASSTVSRFLDGAEARRSTLSAFERAFGLRPGELSGGERPRLSHRQRAQEEEELLEMWRRLPELAREGLLLVIRAQQPPTGESDAQDSETQG